MNLYVPVPVVVVVRLPPISARLVSVTATPGRTALLWSVTVPVMVPVSV